MYVCMHWKTVGIVNYVAVRCNIEYCILFKCVVHRNKVYISHGNVDLNFRSIAIFDGIEKYREIRLNKSCCVVQGNTVHRNKIPPCRLLCLTALHDCNKNERYWGAQTCTLKPGLGRREHVTSNAIGYCSMLRCAVQYNCCVQYSTLQ